MKSIAKTMGRCALFLLIFSVLCGGIYTAAVTGIAQVAFPKQANGSLITVGDKTYGSALLGQQFEDEAHLWGRVMNVDVTTYQGDDGQAVSYAAPSNESPATPEYAARIEERVAKLRAAHPEKDLAAVPVDLVTCSGSGLDPHISPKAAAYQVERVAAATGRSVDDVQSIIDTHTEGKFLGLFGEARVNVLAVNLALDGILQ